MIFRQATFRLTMLFSAILLLLFGLFAGGVYLFVVASFDYDSAADTGPDAVDAAEQSFADLRSGLLLGYAALIVIVPVVCYFLVRLVLKPVRRGFEAQQSFVDDASHEFRTPLSIIQGELELVISQPRSAADYVAAITTALDEVEHLTTLTSDLLLLSRSSAAELSAVFQLVDLREAINCAIDVHARDPSAGCIQVDSPDLTVLGSRNLLIQAIGNVIDNAIKFSPVGSTVSVSVEQHGDRARIDIVDTGPGLSRAQQELVFDRFWRAETSRTLPGRGLGLALVKQIMAAHHGMARVESDGVTCTRVTLEIPVARI